MIKINVVILLVVLCGCIVPSKEELTTRAGICYQRYLEAQPVPFDCGSAIKYGQ